MMSMMLAAAAAIAAASTPQPAPVQFMVLDTYHFGNLGRDKVNVHVDDVTAPRRQRELEALADAIATFRPTRVTTPGYRSLDVRPYLQRAAEQVR